MRREAELSARTLGELQRVAATRGQGTVVLIRDDRSQKPSLESSFAIQEAADLMVAPRIMVWLDPSPGQPSRGDVEFTLKQGALTPLPTAGAGPTERAVSGDGSRSAVPPR